jgi:hypothetical protein
VPDLKSLQRWQRTPYECDLSSASERIFRAAAIERLSSPQQLDQLVRIILLRHNLVRLYVAALLLQQGHRGKVLMST